MPYQEILSRAWQIFKRQRALWLFGFLSACTGGTYGRVAMPGFNFQMPSFSPSHGGAGGPTPLPPGMERWLHIVNTIPPRLWLLIGVGLLTLLFVWLLIVLVVRAFADPSLLRGILAATREDRVLSAGEIFAEGKRFFWRVVGYILLIGGGVVVLATSISILTVVIAIFTLGIGLLCLIPLVLLMIPLVWLIGLYLEITLLALVVEDLPLLQAFSRGWEVLKRNFWNAVLMGLLLTVIRIGVALVVGIILLFLALPTAGPLVAIAIATHAAHFMIFAAFGILIVATLFLVSAFLMGLLQTYLQSAWVLAYLHFIGGESQAQESSLPEPAPPAPPETEAGPPPASPAEPAAFAAA